MTAPAASSSAAMAARSGAVAAGWRSPRNWIATAVIAVWVPGCGVACWWQVNIALSGDGLGWAYSVMWPCFAVFGLIAWWQFVHDDPETVGARGLRRLREIALREESHPRVAAPGDAELPPHLRAPFATGPLVDAMAKGEEVDDNDEELAEYNAYLTALAAGAPKTWRRSRS